MGWKEKNRPLVHRHVKRIWSSCFGQYIWRESGVWHGGKRSRGGWLRHMRTTAEFRAYDPEFCRAKRAPSRLPDVREDYWRRPEKNWKRHRIRQFKEK